MNSLEYKLVIFENGKEVLTEPLSFEMISVISNNYPDKERCRDFFLYTCRHPSVEVRQYIAYKDNIDEEICRILSKDDTCNVLKTLLRNSTFRQIASIEDLESIITKDVELALIVAEDIEMYTSVDVIKLANIILKNSDPNVVFALARNSRAPKKILRELLNHNDITISEAARASLR